MSQPIDPTRMREQPSLRSSTGAIWLIVGGLLALVAAVILTLLTSLQAPLAITGLVIVVVLYAAMIVIRLFVPEGRRRLALMAGCMLAIAAASLIIVGIIAATEWQALGD